MKQTKNNHQEETEEIKTSNKVQIQKMSPSSLCLTGAKKKTSYHKLHRANHDNFIKSQKMLEGTVRRQSDPAGQVIHLSTKRFCKDT